jgi:hypothetical protein
MHSPFSIPGLITAFLHEFRISLLIVIPKSHPDPLEGTGNHRKFRTLLKDTRLHFQSPDESMFQGLEAVPHARWQQESGSYDASPQGIENQEEGCHVLVEKEHYWSFLPEPAAQLSDISANKPAKEPSMIRGVAKALRLEYR